MTKVIAVTALVLLLHGCTSIQSVSNIEMGEDRGNLISVALEKTEHKYDQELNKYKRAANLAEQALNSGQFKTRVLAGSKKQHYIYPSNQESQTRNCPGDLKSTYTYNVVNDACMTNRKIFESIKAASWEMSTKINYRWWALWCGRPFINEVGHREGKIIVTQKCQFDGMTDAQLAGHLIHEHLHVIGFDHPYEQSPNRKYTIPYFVGNIAAELLGK